MRFHPHDSVEYGQETKPIRNQSDLEWLMSNSLGLILLADHSF